MLSGETAMGAFPVRAVEMMARIAFDVESKIDFRTYPPVDDTPLTALCRATNQIAKVINPSCIAVLTASGLSARAVAAERPNAPVFALTTHLRVYHGLNLLWGVTPILIAEHPDTFEEMVLVIVNNLVSRKLVGKGEKVVIVGGIPAHRHGGTNFVKIHQVG
jgi:pyruvate kinase